MKAQLGLATTAEMLEELKVRGMMESYSLEYPGSGRKLEAFASVLLEVLPEGILNYSTVEGR